MIEAVSTVAVVVPSPALSLVFEATSRTMQAPMFSNLSSKFDLLGDGDTVLGDARRAVGYAEAMTLRPFGPGVTLTALLRISTPRSMRSRASGREAYVFGGHDVQSMV